MVDVFAAICHGLPRSSRARVSIIVVVMLTVAAIQTIRSSLLLRNPVTQTIAAERGSSSPRENNLNSPQPPVLTTKTNVHSPAQAQAVLQFVNEYKSELLGKDSKLLTLPQLSPLNSETNTVLPGELFNNQILILSPVCDTASKLRKFFQSLAALTYNHSLVSVAFGEDSSSDSTSKTIRQYIDLLNGTFRKMELFHFEQRHFQLFNRKSERSQLERRAHLAAARNQLLFDALTPDIDWVLWIDSDVRFFPPNLIEHLLSARKDVVVPSCLYETGMGLYELYDRNSWRETPESLEFLNRNSESFLKLEGYGQSLRHYITDLRSEGLVVRLDGVGGCVLLVRASCHRKGLIFPTFVFDHHIETEGLGKMATKMGFEVFGLPSVSVVHS